jgi:hypothetical protein
MCSTAPFLTFVSTIQKSGHHYRPDCNKWSCCECRPQLEANWNYHAGILFDTCPDGIGYLCVPESRLQAVLKRFRRAKCQYIRVRGHGNYHFYVGNAELGKYRLDRDRAVEFFAEHIAQAPARQGHVISTSRAWRAQQRKKATIQGIQPETDSICVAVGVSKESVCGILQQLSLPASTSGEAMSFDLASSEKLDRFVEAVKLAKRECPHLPSHTRKASGNTDRAVKACLAPKEIGRNPAFDNLRTGLAVVT